MDNDGPMFVLTDNLCKALENVINMKIVDEKLLRQCKEVYDAGEQDGVISLELIRDIYTNLRQNGHLIYLHDLMEGSSLVLKPPITPPRDPELDARVKRLKIEEENKEYKRMTQNVDPNQTKEATFSFQGEVKAMNRQLTSVFNMIITTAAGFAFGYKVVEMTYGQLFPMQMLSGMLCGTLIFFVDLYFMVKSL